MRGTAWIWVCVLALVVQLGLPSLTSFRLDKQGRTARTVVAKQHAKPKCPMCAKGNKCCCCASGGGCSCQVASVFVAQPPPQLVLLPNFDRATAFWAPAFQDQRSPAGTIEKQLSGLESIDSDDPPPKLA